MSKEIYEEEKEEKETTTLTSEEIKIKQKPIT